MKTYLPLACAFFLSQVGPSAAAYFQPGETMGVSLNSPLPEGVFFADLEDYGRGDAQPQVNIGVNIPIIIWSTPWTFYNTRLEFLVGTPFVHTDGPVNLVGFLPTGGGPILAHDFGNGITGGFAAFVKTPSASSNLRAIDGRTVTEGDFRESLQYTNPQTGLTFNQNIAVSSALGQNYYGPGVQNDALAYDFTAEKTFNKFTIGFTGFGVHELDNRNGFRQESLALGGLAEYDFGSFSLTGIVTRSVYVKGGAAGVSDNIATGYETRGWMRIIVPLYIAPQPTAVVARY